jgi:hydroxymethylglutaryl-CoA reductase (NADPH)
MTKPPAVDEGQRHRIPRDPTDDYTESAARARREFVASKAGGDLSHVAGYSIDPVTLRGNIENFIGAAQVPIGIAGPLLMNGEHARGEFYVPLATTEGALVASYNRGMRLLHAAGGVRATVVDDRMQRSPVFSLPDALRARDFGDWIEENLDEIGAAAEATTRVGEFIGLEKFALGPLLYLRVNFRTGDAAGQNMTSRATLAACQWIQAAHPDHPDFMLSGNTDTDKKHSAMNTIMTRGKRVIAEVTLPADALRDIMKVDPASLFRARQISQAGAFLAGSANNGSHSANGLTALFIATGQDVANVAESHAAIAYTQLIENGDYYWSITLPSLIVATHGGGTGLATQRECLALLGCSEPGSVRKLAEIAGGLVLAGEISLASAVLHGDWVAGHESLGRNR